MPAKKTKTNKKKSVSKESTANIGNEAELWKKVERDNPNLQSKLLADDVRRRYGTPSVGNANDA